MKILKITYWISTLVICLLMLFSAYNYLFHYERTMGFYENLGFPIWMIYPSATVKILAVIAILSKLSNFLKEWAYAGIFFDVIMAFTAHQMVNDGMGLFALVGIFAVSISYITEGLLFGNLAIPKKT